MRHTKRFLSLLLALFLTCCLFAGCGNSSSEEQAESPSQEAEEASPPANDAAPAESEDNSPPAESAPEEIPPAAEPQDDMPSVGEYTLPLTEENRSISLWHQVFPGCMSYIDSFDENYVVIEANRITNVYLDCITISGMAAAESFFVIWAFSATAAANSVLFISNSSCNGFQI